MIEDDYTDLLEFEHSDRYDARQKAALLYTSMLVWNPAGVDAVLWQSLREHFSEEQIVELGSFVCLTFGQQRVIKTWDVGHGELLADTRGGLVGG